MNGKVGLFPIMVVWLLVLLVLIGSLVALKHGHPIIGTVLGLGVLLPLATCCVGVFVLDMWQPVSPVCRSGKCKKYKDYKYVKSTDAGQIYRCRCGTEYLRTGTSSRTSRERRFVELLADGTTRPYMKHTRFGRWKQDDQKQQVNRDGNR